MVDDSSCHYPIGTGSNVYFFHAASLPPVHSTTKFVISEQAPGSYLGAQPHPNEDEDKYLPGRTQTLTVILASLDVGPALSKFRGIHIRGPVV